MMSATVKMRIVSQSLPAFIRCDSLVLAIAIFTARIAHAAEMSRSTRQTKPLGFMDQHQSQAQETNK